MNNLAHDQNAMSCNTAYKPIFIRRRYLIALPYEEQVADAGPNSDSHK